MLAMALHLRDAEKLSLRDIAPRLVITRSKKKGQHPSPATVLRMLRDHDDQMAADAEMQTQNDHAVGLGGVPVLHPAIVPRPHRRTPPPTPGPTGDTGGGVERVQHL